MKPLDLVADKNTDPELQKFFDKLKKNIGRVPNFYSVCANSPAALKGLLAFREQLEQGELSLKEAHAIALVVGQKNECDYCLRAHTMMGKRAGSTEQDTLDYRKGKAADPKMNALLRLTAEMAANKGSAAPATIEAFFSAGYSKAALVEVAGMIALNVFTNYVNHIAHTEADFPEVKKV
ncbi:MAG: carboxymuconolactone decarboxylase family protein [Candidatus Omnitrophica bacterium]|nr:carboxymuconolactone decarboxylase family protein [Candidatus Omnitrophota bacterium]